MVEIIEEKMINQNKSVDNNINIYRLDIKPVKQKNCANLRQNNYM